jgi:YVTN family beta-propeller protein
VAVFVLVKPVLAFEHPVLLVTDREGNRVFFVHPETHETVASIRTGDEPREIAVTPDGKTAYVANYNDPKNTITVLDLVDLVKVKDINPEPDWLPHGLAITKDGKRLYAACTATRSVSEMSLPDGKVLRSIKTMEKLGRQLVLTPDNKTIYVANQVNGNVTYIDVAAGARKGSIRSGDGCEGIAVSPDGKEVWTTNRRDNTILVIDTATKKPKNQLDCEGYPLRVEFTLDGRNALVSCAELNEIAVFDASSYEIVGKVATEAVPVGITFKPDGKRAYTANFGAGSVTEIDLGTLKPVASFPVGKKPYGIRYIEATK